MHTVLRHDETLRHDGALRHEETRSWDVMQEGDDARTVHEKLDRIAAAVEAMDARRQELEELVTDLMPAVNGAIGIAIHRLDEMEKDGTLAFVREAANAFGRVGRTIDPQRVQRLADNADALLHLAELASSPELAAILERTVDAVGQAHKGRPPKLRQLVRATREPRVRRGLSATLNILRAIGSGVRGSAVPSPAPAARPVAPARARSAPQRPAASPATAHCPSPVAAPAAGAKRRLAGEDIAFDAEGFMTDSSAWTREIAQAIAADYGIPELTHAHWNVIDFCRDDARASGAAPGLRRITTSLGIPPREMYALFPKGPGMLAARIAGLPKPKSCV